jgi:hypothetical protein
MDGRTAPPAPLQDSLQPIVEDLKKVKHFLPFVKGFLDLEFQP